MIERFKILSHTVSHQPPSESQFLLWVLNIVTQQCSCKSTDPLTCFGQLFIARFSYALFSLILSHADFVRVFMCVQVHTSLLCAHMCVC